MNNIELERKALDESIKSFSIALEKDMELIPLP